MDGRDYRAFGCVCRIAWDLTYNAFEPIIGAVLYGEICTVFQERFYFFFAIFLDDFMQVMKSCNQGPASKQGGDLWAFGGDVFRSVPATFGQLEKAIGWSMVSDACWGEITVDKDESVVLLTWYTNRSNLHTGPVPDLQLVDEPG